MNPSDLIDVYMHNIGRSEVPREFHYWSAVSMVASAMGDRLRIFKFPHKPLMANLYILLIGPSACGKDHAIDPAVAYLTDLENVNVYEGKLTGAHFIDILTRITRKMDGAGGANLLLVTEELAMSMGKGERASDMVKDLTKFYTSSGAMRALVEGTRMHGEKVIVGPCVNWLAGTTKQWLTQSITRDDIQSGFLSRLIPVMQTYSVERVANPSMPSNYWEIKEYIQRRVFEISTMSGEMQMTEQARKIRDHWYERRPMPDNEFVLSWWKRADDLVFKLSMIFSCAERYDRVITQKHVSRAIQRVSELESTLPDIVALSYKSDESFGVEVVRGIIRKRKTIQHTQLLRQISRQGYTAVQMRAQLSHLVEERTIRCWTRDNKEVRYVPAYWYTWAQQIDLSSATAEEDEGDV